MHGGQAAGDGSMVPQGIPQGCPGVSLGLPWWDPRGCLKLIPAPRILGTKQSAHRHRWKVAVTTGLDLVVSGMPWRASLSHPFAICYLPILFVH